MRGSEWEREAFLTIFDKSEIILQQNIGIRVKEQGIIPKKVLIFMQVKNMVNHHLKLIY